jgi:hypothetical protein
MSQAMGRIHEDVSALREEMRYVRYTLAEGRRKRKGAVAGDAATAAGGAESADGAGSVQGEGLGGMEAVLEGGRWEGVGVVEEEAAKGRGWGGATVWGFGGVGTVLASAGVGAGVAALVLVLGGRAG